MSGGNVGGYAAHENLNDSVNNLNRSEYDAAIKKLDSWEQEAYAADQLFESYERLIEDPKMDLLTAVLLAGQLSLIQMQNFSALQAEEMERQYDRLVDYKQSYRKFINTSLELSKKETETFADLPTPTTQSGLESWVSKIKSFYSEAFNRTEDSGKDFDELYQAYFGQSIMDDDLPDIMSVFNGINADTMIDKAFDGNRAWQIYKNVEGFSANLLLGARAEKVMPGTDVMGRGIFQAKDALSSYLVAINNAAKNRMQAVIKREQSQYDITLDVFQSLVSDFGSAQLQTIRRIMEIYYNAALKIVERTLV